MFNNDFYESVIKFRKISKSSFIEKEVLRRLIYRLSFINLDCNNILEIGTGVSNINKSLIEKFPKSNIFNVDLSLSNLQNDKHKFKNCYQVQANFNNKFPFKSNSFDLIISNLSLNSVKSFKKTFQEILRILKPKGTLIFSLFGFDTLKEIDFIFKKVDSFEHKNLGVEMHQIGDILTKLGFMNIVLDCEWINLEYKNLLEAFYDIRKVEPILMENKRDNFLTKKDLNILIKEFEKIKKLTFELVFIHCTKSEDFLANNNQELKFRTDDLKFLLNQFKKGK